MQKAYEKKFRTLRGEIKSRRRNLEKAAIPVMKAHHERRRHVLDQSEQRRQEAEPFFLEGHRANEAAACQIAVTSCRRRYKRPW